MGNKLSSTRNNPINSNDLESVVVLGGRRVSSSDEAEARPLRMRVLHRVPPRMREKKKHVYDPSVLSLGPYHHGQPHLRQLEEFKDEVVKVMLKEDEIRLVFRGRILERVDDIRHFYEGLSRDELSDDALAEMMLRDACVLLFFLEFNVMKEDNAESHALVFNSLGSFQSIQARGDLLKLENQIPWWLMNSLISLTYDDDDDDEEKGKDFIRRLFSFQLFKNPTDLKQIPWHQNKDEYYPLHFLEATRNASVAVDKIGIVCVKQSPSRGILQPGKRSFRSVSELKAKGIYFKPSSRFVNDITFTSFYVFGVLQLPVLAVFKTTGVAFSNVMALEMSVGTPCADFMLTAYVTFMKSMIQSIEDVKLLQEKGIIVSFTDDNEEIVRIFKEMETYGITFPPIFYETKIRINQYCDNKAKTWIAELFNTNFNSPWTIVTFLAATLLLCLTFLQTYYTIGPKN